MMNSNESKKYLIYGPVASGKTTLAKNWARASGIEYLSVGDITRNEIVSKTPIGLVLLDCFEKWIPYPVDTITTLITNKIDLAHDTGTGLILDGFPKFPDEAAALLSQRAQLFFSAAVMITLPLGESLDRMARRRICVSCQKQTTLNTQDEIRPCVSCGGELKCRDDDKPEIVRRRYTDHARFIDRTLTMMASNVGKTVYLDGLKTQEELLRRVMAEC